MKKLNNYIIILSPFILCSGPFFADLFFSYFALVFFFLIKTEFIRSILKTLLFKGFCIFFLYIFLRSMLSDNIHLSLESSLFYSRFLFGSLSIAYYFIEKKLIKKFSISVIIVFLILFVDSYYQYFFGVNLIGFEKINENRISSFFGTESILGSFLSRMFFLVFLSFLTFKISKRINSNFILLFLIINTFVIIVLSGERTALFLFCICIFGISIIEKKYIYLIYSSFFISFIFVTIFSINTDRIFSETFKQIGLNSLVNQSNLDDREIYIYSSQHQKHFITALNLFKEKPLFGYGPKTFRIVCKKENIDIGGCSTHPHNYSLQLLSETGITGFVFYIVFYCFMIKEIFSNRIKNNNNIIFFKISVLGLLINFFPFIPTGNFFGNAINTLNYIPIVFYFVYKYKK